MVSGDVPDRRGLPGRRTRPAAEALALACVVASLYWPFLRLNSLTTGGDMANLFFPAFAWAAESISQNGIFPLWNPYDFCGHPFAAAAQSAVFYLPGRVLYFVLGGVPVAAMNLFILFHLFLAGLGVRAFARSRTGLGLRGAGPWCAGLAFAGSAWWWGQTEHAAALATTAWLPWLVWAAGRMARRASPRSVALFALVLTLQLLAGHPQEAFYCLMGASAWALWSALRAARETGRGRFRSLGISIVLLLLGCAMAGLLASIQLLPTFELSGRSYRQFDSREYAAQYSMPLRLLALLVSPHAFGSYAEGYAVPMAYGEYGIYVGVPVLLLAALGWFTGRWRRRSRAPGRGASALWAGVAVAAILLALGGNADLRRVVAPGRVDAARPEEFPQLGWSPLALLARAVPPVRHFRVPARILVLWSLAAALLAARGIRFIEIGIRKSRGGNGKGNGSGPGRRREVSGKWIVAFDVACAAAIFLSLFLPSLKERMVFQANYKNALAIGREMAAPIPGGEALENRVYRLTLLDDELLARDGTAAGATPADRDLESRVATRVAILSPDTNLLSGRALVDGYEEGLLPTVRYKDFLFTFNRSFRDANPDARLLALGGVRWLWSELPIQSAQWERVDRKRAASGRRGGADGQDGATGTNGDFGALGGSGSIGAVYRNTLWRGVAFDKAAFPGVDWSALDGTWLRDGALALRRHGARLPYTTPSDAPLPDPTNASPEWRAEITNANQYIFSKSDSMDPSKAPAGKDPGGKSDKSDQSDQSDRSDRSDLLDRSEQANPTKSFTESADSAATTPSTSSTQSTRSTSSTQSSPLRSLIVAQAVYPGWVARDAQGRRFPMKPLNAWNTEIQRASGQTRIHFDYEPWSFRLGAFLSALGTALFFFLATFAGPCQEPCRLHYEVRRSNRE